jgi:hypothetical protein
VKRVRISSVFSQSSNRQLTAVYQALIEAKLNDFYDAIRIATYGIVFFATPHQGGNHAKLGDIAASVAKGMLRNPENTFLDALKKDSLFAEGIIKDFRHQLENYFVISLYETLPYKKMGLVRGQIFPTNCSTTDTIRSWTKDLRLLTSLGSVRFKLAWPQTILQSADLKILTILITGNS